MTEVMTNRDSESATAPAEARSLASRVATPGFAIFLLVLVFTAPVVHHWGEQQGSRYALTAALWDQQTVVIDDYTHLLGRDHAVKDGVTYSDKAPGQPFLAVPFYGIYRLLGGSSPVEDFDFDADLGMWWVTFWSAAVPGAILAALMYRWAREVEERTALLATITMALGTMLLVYSTILFGHVLAALFAFGMFLVVRRPGASWLMLLGAGALGGAAVLTEYPVALIVGVITIAAIARHRARALAILAGGLPAAVLLGLYNMRLFDSPFTFTYQWSGFSGPRQEAGDVLAAFVGPTIERFLHVLFSPRGLLIATPVVLVAVLGLIPMWRRGWRFDVLVIAAAVVLTLAVPGSWSNSYAGGAGPRYFTPALALLVVPLAIAWSRWRRPVAIAGAISLVTMAAATMTEPQVATVQEAGLEFWLALALNGDIEPNVYTMALGAWGWLVFLGTLVLAGWFLAKTLSRVDDTVELVDTSDGGSPRRPNSA